MSSIRGFSEFRSMADLSRAIRLSADLQMADFDVVVGIPRSGMIPASIIALHKNLPLTELDSFTSGAVFAHGITRAAKGYNPENHYTRPLIVDDSVNSGKSIAIARDKISRVDCKPVFFAAYVHERSKKLVDISLEKVRTPRIFEWNLWHHSDSLKHSCFDLDGVLGADPTIEENDDAENYRRFLSDAKPLVRPSYQLGHIVTSRLERYRSQTEEWLEKNGIGYENLHMLDLASAEERRRLKIHASFKASVYKQTNTSLFVESDNAQAAEIFRLTGWPVLDYTNMVFFSAKGVTLDTGTRHLGVVSQRILRRIRRMGG